MIDRSSTIPSHLPHRLTICLWDFSWYTQTMPGEPFHDLDRAFAETVERGYNTVRICAMPYLLFSSETGPEDNLHFTNMGGAFGQRTRWYNAAGGATLDGRVHLLRLFEAAKRCGCFVILSSWEYQQSPSFLDSSTWYTELMRIAPSDRFQALGVAMARLIAYIKERGLGDRIAYAELHNEIDMAKLRDVASPGEDSTAAQKPYVEQAISTLRSAHPDVLATVCYGAAPVAHMRYLPGNLQVAHFHLYIYGVLGQLIEHLGLGSSVPAFPNEVSTSILRPDAPPLEDWQPRPHEHWRLEATGVRQRLFYLHDWADPKRWDLWLYDQYGAHRQAMRESIKLRLEIIADWSDQQGVPAVIGEGYVGYTPLLTGFEEGPVGKDIAEYAIETSLRLGFWGMVLCSNAAPHHPFWLDIDWQRSMNERILRS